MNKKNKGFTLIEMMIVIAIIAILSGLVLTGLASSRAKARDSRRLSSAKTMQAIVESYYDGATGAYGGVTEVQTVLTASKDTLIDDVTYSIAGTGATANYCLNVIGFEKRVAASDGCSDCTVALHGQICTCSGTVLCLHN